MNESSLDIQNIPGSKWWKIDFHAHSPASNDYGREDASLKNIAPEDWLQKAMQAGLDCVVLSDHNSGGWIDCLKAKNKALQEQENKPDWFRELTIFPGVEITVADSSSRVHLLAVFDPSCGSQKVAAVLGKCGIDDDRKFGDDRISTTTGFLDTVQHIKKADGIAIAAHIDSAKGLLENATSLTPELKNSLQAVVAAEFCDSAKFDQATPELRDAVNCLAKLGGSDAHKPDEIGKYFSWLKMSKPSIEGLRLALMDHQYCVKKQQVENPNCLPDLYLSHLTIKKMSHCGRIPDQPFGIRLNPHFNAVIGGRGTGKSTVIESIRIAARRNQNLEQEAPKIKRRLDTFDKLSQGKDKEGVMLKETKICLELHRRGKDFRLRWQFDGQGAVLEEQEGNGWQETEQGDLNERFPLSIYSQKQIEELAANPGGLLAIIDRTSAVGRSAWQSEWERVKSEFLQLREQKRDIVRQLAEEPQLRITLKDIEDDLQRYEEQGHGAILKQYQKRIQQKNGLPGEQIFDDLSSGMRKLAESAELSDFPEHLFDEHNETTVELWTIHEQTAQELKAIVTALQSIAEQADAVKRKHHEAVASSKWQQSVQDSIASYESLLREYQQKNSSLSDYSRWVQERNILQQKLNRFDRLLKEKESVEQNIKEKLNCLASMRNELFERRRNFINSVIGRSDYVRMKLVQFGDVSRLEEDYRALLNIDNFHNSSVLDEEGGILHELHNWQNNPQLPDIPKLIQEIKNKTRAIAEGSDSSYHGKFCNKLKELFQRQPSLFDQLDVWWPEDLLRVQHSKNGKFDNLEKGSAGQKAAAIFAFLLSHGDEPLVIDQPEDDLDNALIYELIVQQIHANKERRQLIIVTHNPNIVVNGDAELVHVLKFAKGQVQIDQRGELEELNIRKAICDIMEGGREAFAKRYKRMMLEEPLDV